MVHSILSLSNISIDILYYILMGTGIYLFSHVFSQILQKMGFGNYLLSHKFTRILQKKAKTTRKIREDGERKSRKIYLISDTHFGHRNIIRYCHRPFRSTITMNSAIRKRWNSTVSSNDLVFFLGDFVVRGSIGYWMTRLKGRKKFIRGNHDYKIKHAIPNTKFSYKGNNFYLVHNPSHAPRNWNGWVIHGHVHNHNTTVYPFIDGIRKRINVSAELIDYRPISLDYILSLNLSNIKRMRTVHSKIEYW